MKPSAAGFNHKESLVADLKALSSAVLQGTTFVFWAYFLAFLPKATFIFYWGLVAVLLLGIFLYWKGEFHITLSRRQIPYLALFGALSGTAFALLTFGVEQVGAALTSFIMPSGIVLTILIATVAFGEKLSQKEIVGIVIAMTGLFILNWQSGSVVTMASVIILSASFALALSHNVAKRLLGGMSGGVVNWFRLLSIAIFGLVYLWWTGSSFLALSLLNFVILVTGVVLGPILVFALFYGSMQKGRLSKSIILKDISPVFTLIFAFIFLGEEPSQIQLLGGLVILAGSLIMLHRKKEMVGPKIKTSKNTLSDYAAIFDIDGVIVDSVRMNWSAIIRVLDEDYGIKFPEEDIKKYVGKTLSGQIAALNKRYGTEINIREFEPKLNNAREDALEFLQAKPGVIGFLERLRRDGVPLAVATSNPRELMVKKLKASKTYHYFQVYVTEDDVERHKPNPDVYIKAAERLGVAPETCVVFEDAPSGVEAAKRAGMYVCAVISDYASKKDLQHADLFVENLGEVKPKMLQELLTR